MSAPIRLQKFLSQAGIAARRKGEELIVAGRVTVNNKVVTVLGTKVDPDRDRISVDGKPVKPQSRLMYYMLNKPKGCVTTMSDPQGRPTVMDYVPKDLPVTLRPIGRLDFYTEGVLVLTNDGELHSALLSPRSNVEKTYHAKIKGEISDEHLKMLRKGVRLDDGRITLPAQVDRLKDTGKNASEQHNWLVITIREGQSRQIHRMAEALGHTVLKLARVSFGGLTYFGVRVGDCRPLTPDEVIQLRSVAGLTNTDGEPLRAQRAPEERSRRTRPVLESTSLAKKRADKPRAGGRPARGSGGGGAGSDRMRRQHKPRDGRKH
jgi:23S rRNA pseudouridine2605 synthase